MVNKVLKETDKVFLSPQNDFKLKLTLVRLKECRVCGITDVLKRRKRFLISVLKKIIDF